MNHATISLTVFLLTSSVITLFLSVYLLSYNKTRLARTFSTLCLLVVFYTFGYGMELQSQDVPTMLLWNLVQYAGVPFMSPVWLVLAVQYCVPGRYGTRTAWSIFAIPVITLILRYTNDLHHLFYSSVRLTSEHPFPVFLLDKGPWYFVQALYNVIAILLASRLYLAKSAESPGNVRKKGILILLSSVPPLFTIVFSAFNLAPYHIDYTAFMMPVAVILFAFVLLRYDFLDLKPYAKEKIFEASNNGILVMDRQYNLVDINPKAAEIIPELNRQFPGKNLKTGLGIDESLAKQIAEPTDKPLEIVQDGKARYYKAGRSDIADKNGNLLGYAVTITEVTKYVESMKQSDYLASRDDLTGLYNRRTFIERSRYELDRARRYEHALSLIILDLDFFKNINDEYGHQGGDAVLKAAAEICSSSLRSIDLLGRLGGEEFIICLPETDLEGALLTAERIRSGIEAMEIPYENHRMRITASIGVTGTDCVTEETFDSFLKSADRALYAAKDDGRNCVRSETLRILS